MKKAQFKNINPKYYGKKVGKKEQSFMADAFVQDDILAIDFYVAKGNTWDICFRTLINEKEYWNWDYENNTWNEINIDGMLEKMFYRHDRGKNKNHICFSNEVKTVINRYLEQIGGCIYSDIVTSVRYKQNSIAYEKRMTAEERKFVRIQEKMKDVPDVPKDFRRFIEDKVYKDDHLMYFGKKDAYCSKCGSSTEKTKDMKHNLVGKCPVCKKRVRYKSVGKMAEHDERKEVLLIQRKDENIILRYFKCSLKSTHISKESLQYSESIRTYHRNDIEWYVDRYVCYVDMFGNTYWRDSMDPWHQVSYGTKTILYPYNIETVETQSFALQHMPLKELAEESITLPWKDILRGRRLQTGIFEKMYKAGLKKLSVEYIRNTYGVDTNYTQRELKKLLLISKPMLQYMQKNNSGKEVLKVLQDAFKNNHGLNDAEIFELAEAGIKVSELAKVSENKKIIKLFHYLQKGKWYASLRTKYQHYEDYMSMGKSLGLDFNNGTVRYPKDLKAAHDKTLVDFYDDETDKKKQKAMRDNPQIRAWCEQLQSIYGFCDAKYLIIPPKNAGEIIEEGRQLHHCVGGDNYLRKHNNGTTFILFMRKADNPQIPYYTIEIDPKDNRIMQYYGKNDKKPDKEMVDDFLAKWKKQLKQKKDVKALAG